MMKHVLRTLLCLAWVAVTSIPAAAATLSPATGDRTPVVTTVLVVVICVAAVAMLVLGIRNKK